MALALIDAISLDAALDAEDNLAVRPRAIRVALPF
jgi:hypothetical protein